MPQSLATINVANLPSVALSRRHHAAAMSRPMVGTPMAGDPHFDDAGSPDPLMTRRACQYAISLLRRDPQFQGDLSGLVAEFEPPERVSFRMERRSVVATVMLPARVMGFDPGIGALAFRGG